MSWFHENKFLAIYGGAVLVAAGALGYLTMTAGAKYDEAKTKFDEKSSQLTSLYGSKPYPKDDNVQLYEKRKQEVTKEITDLQTKLSAIKVKTEEISPNSFQDKLKESVVKATTKAGEMDAILPKDFYLGFNSYKDKPPFSNIAAATLYKELRAMELVMDLVFQVKGVEIKELTREELKEEHQPDPKPGDKSKAEPKKLIRKAQFSIKFVTTQSHFISLVNGVSGNDKQLFVIRNVHVTNTAETSPPKVKVGGAAQPAAGPNAPAPADTGLETVFGTEKLTVDLDIDITDVADPDAPATPAKANSKSK